MAVCDGNRAEHCCWISGVVCPYLEERTIGERRWVCGLLLQYGSWDAVHRSTEYLETDAAAMFARRYPGYGCGDWPQNIPDVMAEGVGLCCWQTEVSLGDLGS